MASSMAQVFVQSIISKVKHISLYNTARNFASATKKKKKVGKETTRHRNLIKSSLQSLEARGFLRSIKPYQPPPNAAAIVSNICEKVLGPEYSLKDKLSRSEKFHLLNSCFKEFNHSVPNSILHKINTTQDVIEFYETPVVTTNPFDVMTERNDLPPNLHIQKEYIRFHPDKDTLFNGISAFPESSTIVTGLKAKEKYEGFRAKLPDIYFNDAHFTKTNLFE